MAAVGKLGTGGGKGKGEGEGEEGDLEISRELEYFDVDRFRGVGAPRDFPLSGRYLFKITIEQISMNYFKIN